MDDVKIYEQKVIDRFGEEVLDKIKEACGISNDINERMKKLEVIHHADISKYNKVVRSIANDIKDKTPVVDKDFAKKTLQHVINCHDDSSRESCDACPYKDKFETGVCIENILGDCVKSLGFLLKNDD